METHNFVVRRDCHTGGPRGSGAWRPMFAGVFGSLSLCLLPSSIFGPLHISLPLAFKVLVERNGRSPTMWAEAPDSHAPVLSQGPHYPERGRLCDPDVFKGGVGRGGLAACRSERPRRHDAFTAVATSEATAGATTTSVSTEEDDVHSRPLRCGAARGGHIGLPQGSRGRDVG